MRVRGGDTAVLARCGVIVWALTTSCEQPLHYERLDCFPRPVQVTGDLREDVVGSWDYFGIDSRVVDTLLGDGGMTIVEAPNKYAPGGGMRRSSYEITDAGITLGGTEVPAVVTASELIFLKADGGYGLRHQALTCRGSDFE